MKNKGLKSLLQQGCWGEKVDHYAYIFDKKGEKVAEYKWGYYLKVRNEYYKEMRNK